MYGAWSHSHRSRIASPLSTARLFCWLFSLWRQCSNIQYSQNTINTPTYLDAKHRAALQKLRDVAQALAVVLGILKDLRKTGRAVGKCESFGSEGLAQVSCTRVHGLDDWLTDYNHIHTHTLRVKQHRGSGQQEEEVTFSDGRRTQWDERDVNNTPLLWRGISKRICHSDQVF